MPKVVVKGESVYKCSVCSRSTRVPTNKQGLDLIQRCVITHGCQGKLHRVTLTREINQTPAFPPEVQGVEDWYQRRVLYTHDQPVQSQTWTIKHDLETKPRVHVYVNRIIDGVKTQVTSNDAVEKVIDLNTIQLTFSTAESGTAQCIALSSQNSTNPPAVNPVQPTTPSIQITSDGGELTIATLSTDPLISITLTYRPAGGAKVNIEYPRIDTQPSIGSPWSNVRNVLVNGRKYTVRTLNLTTTPLAPAYFAAGDIPAGSTFYVSAISGAPPAVGSCIILLGTAPYGTVDKTYTSYIDPAYVSKGSPQLFYDTGKGFAFTSIVRPTYPPVLVV